MPQHPDDRRPRRRPLCECGHSYSTHRGAEHLRHAKGACRAASHTRPDLGGTLSAPCPCREYRPVAPRREIQDADGGR